MPTRPARPARPARPLARALALLTAATLAGVGLTGVTAAPATAGMTVEANLVQRINNARARNGLPPLALRAGLSDYARRQSARMAEARSLFHTASFSAICCWSSITENVGVAGSARQVHLNFLGSPSHRANILDRSKREVGVGVVRSGGQLWVTEIFRERR